MKTFKLIMIKGEIDISSYKENKFPIKEDIEKKIAKKLKKPLSEIKKKKLLVNSVMKKKMDDFFDTKIIKDNAHIIESVINYKKNKSDKDYIDNNINARDGFNGWQYKSKYDFVTKTLNITLNYKNRIEYETAGNQQTIEINEDFLKGRRKNEDGSYESFPKSKYIRWFGQKSWDARIEKTKKLKEEIYTGLPKFVKHWTTPEGKKEIELIEKTLESLGKIKFEIYDVKGKKIETLYTKYKRTTEVYNFNETVKEIISTHTKNGITQETFRTRNSIGMSISIK
jgi:hypothetical protein